MPLETRIAFGASGSAYALSRALSYLGYNDITVAHPMELSWITKSKKKYDRVDSIKLENCIYHIVSILISQLLTHHRTMLL